MASAQMHVTGTVENPLCGRLQQKFSGRGAAAVSARRQTQEIPRVDGKIAKTVNPFEETAEFVPAGKRTAAQTKTKAQGTISAKAAPSAAQRAAYEAQQRTRAFARVTPFPSGAYASAYARAASIRAQAAAVQSRPHVSAKKEERTKDGLLQMIRGGRADEVRVKSSPVPKSILIAIVLFTAVVLMIIFIFAQINEFKQIGRAHV